MRQWAGVLVWVVVLALGSSTSTRAGENDKQVEELQKQLAAMQEEMNGLRKALEEKGVPPDARATMQGHMTRMDQQMQSMHHQCCMMDPAGCQHMGTPPQTTPPQTP